MFKTNSFPNLEDEKIVLRASQLLEELKCLSNDSCTSDASVVHKFDIFHSHKLPGDQFKNALLLRDKMKHLLLRRYILSLKMSYRRCMMLYEQLFKECWHVTKLEKHKLVNHTLIGYNQFPERHVFDSVSIKVLPDKLYQHDQHWRTINGNFQRILGLSHGAFNYEFVQILHCSNIMLNVSQIPVLFLVSSYLNICLEKICFYDPSSITSDFISNALDTCKDFNNFLCHRKNNYEKCCDNMLLLRSFKKSCIMVDWKYLITFLANFEADIAANKITSVIIPIIYKIVKTMNYEYRINWVPETVSQVSALTDVVTSDYSSASFSNGDIFCDIHLVDPRKKEKFSAKADLLLLSAFESIITRNQTLLLKYLFAKTKNAEQEEQYIFSDVYSFNNEVHQKIWSRPQPVSLNAFNHERIYWTNFWKKLNECIIKILLELPLHNHTDKSPGSILIWKESYVAVLLKILKTSLESDEISSEGRECLKHTFTQIFSLHSFMVWDQSFSSTVATIKKPYCIPIPIANGNIGTKPGNLFHVTLRPVLSTFLACEWIKSTVPVCAINCLVATLDCFKRWACLQEKALISSWDFPTYLVIVYSDIMRVQCLLDHVFSEYSTSFQLNKIAPFHSTVSWNELLNKLDEIQHLNDGIPVLVYKRIYAFTCEKIMVSKPSLCSCAFTGRTASNPNEIVEEMIELILYPILETTLQIQCSNDDKWGAFEAAIISQLQAYLDFLDREKSKISHRHCVILCDESKQLLTWMENHFGRRKEHTSIPVRCQDKILPLMKSLNLRRNVITRSRRGNRVQPM